MKLEVNPTRMELLVLKKRTNLAKRGHKLLKDKQDELIRKLLDLLRIVRELRNKVERGLDSAIKRFIFAKSSMEIGEADECLLLPSKEFLIEIENRKIFNVEVPMFKKSIKGKIYSYGFATTSCELDLSLLDIEKVLSELIEVAEKEKILELLAIEIEKTRRRVNALEYILIPSLEETVKYIQMKLAEMERADHSRLMIIKEIVRAH